VNRFANALKSLGVGAGDRVVLYMPLVPEGIVSMLACARIGAIHSVVYAGMGSQSLKARIEDAGAKVVISSRKAEACEAVRAEFEREVLSAIAKACNVSRKDEVQALVEHTLSTWGRIDTLVCNAAINPYYGPIAGLPDETFAKVMTANV
jgi:acyl-coenzyme A synthetase/AMP-(fatty) acid ligase